MDFKNCILVLFLLTSAWGNKIEQSSEIEVSVVENVAAVEKQTVITINDVQKDVELVKQEIELLSTRFNQCLKTIQVKTTKILASEKIILNELWEKIKISKVTKVETKRERLQKVKESWQILKSKISGWIREEKSTIVERWLELHNQGNLCLTDAEKVLVNNDVVLIEGWKSQLDQWMKSKETFVKVDLNNFELKLAVIEEALNILVKTHLETVINGDGGLKVGGFEVLVEDAFHNVKKSGTVVRESILQDLLQTSIKGVKHVVNIGGNLVATAGTVAATGVGSVKGIIAGAADIVFSLIKGGHDVIFNFLG